MKGAMNSHADAILPLAAAPDWFRSCLASGPERSRVRVKETDIETLAWGPVGAPGLLLLHGQAANADWWSFIAPLLAGRFRVVALSWSGMGRSGWRDVYDFPTYAEEIFAVAYGCGLYASGSPPYCAAHSFGGIPLIYAASRRGAELSGAILIDSYFRPDSISKASRAVETDRSHRVYGTLEEAIARFRLRPPQRCDLAYIIDYVARHSLKPLDGGGWTWRFDPALRSKTHKLQIAPHLSRVKCRIAFVAGERSSLITPIVKENQLGLAPPGTPWVVIPDAAHHIMLDQPLALVSALAALLEVWVGA
jgi:pimeloyl-ACP methyl ester carboxylesterase